MGSDQEKDEVMNAKTIKMREFLAANKIECFALQEMENEEQTAIFRSHMQVKGQTLPFAILIDTSVYTLLQVQIATGVAQGEKFLKIAPFLNEINNNYRLFKFVVSPDGDVLLNACLTAKDDKFDPDLINAILGETLKFLESEYPKFMSRIWDEK
ncbi:YbjN domain-containing protein [Sporomusa sp. KB1]|uniref:YbjN domain-containing protein n=1 Tax=Sporomusa sp. KB1 TaxID=943346 RepID=UPI0011ABBC53|nr:YbjN domain-containing protein [Sporomusa sp. KB1]TWH49253.1 putative sensory transduction regulator [Sporomusa sp. KB1]